MRKFLGVSVLCLLLAGCGAANKTVPPASQPPPVAAAQIVGPWSISVSTNGPDGFPFGTIQARAYSITAANCQPLSVLNFTPGICSAGSSSVSGTLWASGPPSDFMNPVSLTIGSGANPIENSATVYFFFTETDQNGDWGFGGSGTYGQDNAIQAVTGQLFCEHPPSSNLQSNCDAWERVAFTATPALPQN